MVSGDVTELQQHSTCSNSNFNLLWPKCSTDKPQWCFPSEMPEKDDPIHSDLAELGAEIIAAKGYEKTKGKSKSYHLKAVAILQCPWREILYLVGGS